MVTFGCQFPSFRAKLNENREIFEHRARENVGNATNLFILFLFSAPPRHCLWEVLQASGFRLTCMLGFGKLCPVSQGVFRGGEGEGEGSRLFPLLADRTKKNVVLILRKKRGPGVGKTPFRGNVRLGLSGPW